VFLPARQARRHPVSSWQLLSVLLLVQQLQAQSVRRQLDRQLYPVLVQHPVRQAHLQLVRRSHPVPDLHLAWQRYPLAAQSLLSAQAHLPARLQHPQLRYRSSRQLAHRQAHHLLQVLRWRYSLQAERHPVARLLLLLVWQASPVAIRIRQMFASA
jgi:hypothetical protein